jgi:probable rRNA maturation factor
VAIEVVNRQRLARIDARRVAALADATLDAIGRKGANLTVAFVRDRFMKALNNEFRGTDKATDVLSFLSADAHANSNDQDVTEGYSEHLGDIVISTDTALKQAVDAGYPLAHEVDELVIHGVLHLCGYDHQADRGQMNRLELKLRRKLLGIRW